MEKPSKSLFFSRIKYQKFLFDLGNVILAADHKITHEYLETLGVSKSKAQLYYSCPAYADFSRGKISEDVFCDFLRVYLDAPTLTNQQLRHAHDIHIYGLVPEMKEFLEEFQSKYIDSVVFVTDTNIWQIARQQELINLNGIVFASNQLHILKADQPTMGMEIGNKNFFQTVLETLKILPQEALLIDDSEEKIKMAQSCGIHTIQFFDRHGLEEALQSKGVNINFEISSPATAKLS